MLYSNVDSLLNKRAELEHLIEENKYDLILLTEILPKNYSALDICEFAIDGYDVFIPSLNSGRGVALYAKMKFNVSIDEDLTNSEFQESIWCRLKLSGADSLLLGVVYRSPSSSDSNNNMLNELLVKASCTKDTHILITGDFNYKNIDWDLKECLISDNVAESFIEFVNDSYLYQHIHEPTRIREGKNPLFLT